MLQNTGIQFCRCSPTPHFSLFSAMLTFIAEREQIQIAICRQMVLVLTFFAVHFLPTRCINTVVIKLFSPTKHKKIRTNLFYEL